MNHDDELEEMELIESLNTKNSELEAINKFRSKISQEKKLIQT